MCNIIRMYRIKRGRGKLNGMWRCLGQTFKGQMVIVRGQRSRSGGGTGERSKCTPTVGQQYPMILTKRKNTLWHGTEMVALQISMSQ